MESGIQVYKSEHGGTRFSISPEAMKTLEKIEKGDFDKAVEVVNQRIFTQKGKGLI